MKIVVLTENTQGKTNATPEHGLSLYIETKNHVLLADTGATDIAWENAKILGIDVSKVDTVFISHGHYDHAGGLLGFSKIQPAAEIYMQKSAGNKYYHGERYIGINPDILQLPTLHLLEGDAVIDEELEIFTNISGRRNWPQSNLVLSEGIDGMLVQDQFVHEQCLVIKDKEEWVLISGCAHNGILNVLDRFEEIYHRYPDRVISGFHMMKKTIYTEQEEGVIRETAKELLSYPTYFHTGHCTGQAAFDIMKEIMGEKLIQLHVGDSFE